jgi:hypothetical protein
MKTEKTCTSYCVSLTDEESKLVLDDETLYNRLDKLPVYKIDYDGHFGAYIFYTVNTEHDTTGLHEDVIRVCRERLVEIQ